MVMANLVVDKKTKKPEAILNDINIKKKKNFKKYKGLKKERDVLSSSITTTNKFSLCRAKYWMAS